MKTNSPVLQRAEFNPRIKKYILYYGTLFLLITIVGIILIPFWLVIAPHFINKYYNRLECEITKRSLRFEKGLIFHTERTIPLDKIQDLTFKEGPLLKAFGLSIFKIETAGNSGQSGSDLTLIGIVNPQQFRQKVFEQRDKVNDNMGSAQSQDSTLQMLTDIRDSLKRIEEKI